MMKTKTTMKIEVDQEELQNLIESWLTQSFAVPVEITDFSVGYSGVKLEAAILIDSPLGTNPLKRESTPGIQLCAHERPDTIPKPPTSFGPHPVVDDDSPI